MIREAVIDDLDTLARLYKELMTYHHGLDPIKFKLPNDKACEKKMRQFIEDNTAKYGMFKTIGHVTNDVVDGYAIYYSIFDKSTEIPNGAFMINHLFVTETARRKGIGTELMRGLLKLAKDNNCEALSIDVHVNNDIARQFYEKLGLIPKSINMEMRF